jgi:acetyl esterase
MAVGSRITGLQPVRDATVRAARARPYIPPTLAAAAPERSAVDIGLANLMDEGAAAHVEQSRAFHAAKLAAGGQQGPTNYEELTKARAGLPARPGDGRARSCEAQAGTRQVPVRITEPSRDRSRAAYLDLHGGGFYMDSAARSDARNARLADVLGVTVVSVEYRLAPEEPWPAAPDDCETAALWLIGEGRELVGSERMLIGGASAGATLGMTTLLRLRDRGLADSVVAAALQFGAYDLSGQSPGGRLYADEWFIEAYAGHVADRTDPDVSPLYGDLRHLPPTLLLVGSLDVLLEDNLALAARLSAAGNEVDLRVYPDSMHGFTSHPVPMAAAALHGVETWLAERLDEQQRAPRRRGTSSADAPR